MTHSRWSVSGLLVALVLVVSALEVWAIRVLNDGVFLYSLDDAYIHLSLAERIAHGHYGINPGETSSPASSILWPGLLVPFVGSRAFALVPLVVNVVAGCGIAVAVARVLERSLGVPDRPRDVLLHAALGSGVLLLVNVIGLEFTGLEHALQVWLTLLAVLALHAASLGERPRAWWWLVLGVGPLVRYENLGVTLPALALLFAWGHRRGAALTLATLVLAMGAFTLFLVRSGLPPLPSSLIAKSLAVGSQGTGLVWIVSRLRENVLSWNGPWFVALLVLLVLGFTRATSTRARGFALAMTMIPALHLLAGAFGMFHRYEMYALAAGVAGLALAHAETLRAWVARRSRVALAATAGLLLVASVKSVYVLWMTPAAAHEIGRQHRMMGVFARDVVAAPVAVNDLGLVAFGNRHTVVDLWGLAHPGAFAARRARLPIAWADSLCRREGVVVAMVYEPWFGELPAGWTRLGTLRLSEHRGAYGSRVRAALERIAHARTRVAVSLPSVQFFAIRPEDLPSLREACRRFRATLVDGAEFVPE